jgi:hypothetical protein
MPARSRTRKSHGHLRASTVTRSWRVGNLARSTSRQFSGFLRAPHVNIGYVHISEAAKLLPN